MQGIAFILSLLVLSFGVEFVNHFEPSDRNPFFEFCAGAQSLMLSQV